MPSDPVHPSGGPVRVAVVGGGIAGLVAARHLLAAGAQVTVLEAGPGFGGQLRTVDVGGLPVDVGAEALHLRSPASATLLVDLGLAGEVVRAAAGPTWLFTGGRLRELPAGFGPGGPSRLWPLVTSRILSPRGVLRAACEPILGRGTTGADEAVGTYLARQFGGEVVARLVDPLLGGLHAGDVGRLSLHAATPQLAAVAGRSRSLVLARRGAPRGGGSGAGFVTLRGGMRTLVDRLVGALGEATLRAGTPVTGIGADGPCYRLETPGGDVQADAVVLAVPSHHATALLRELAPEVAATLAGQTSASVAVAVHTYPADVVAETPALAGTGVLVGSREGRLLKAATFLGTKWPHLADGDRYLVRLSAGRVDDQRPDAYADDELSARLHEDLSAITGLRSAPVEATVHRWPQGMPQLEVGHASRLRGVRDALAATHPRIALAGASYDGVGIAACLPSGERAAAQVLSAVAAQEVSR